MTLRQAAALATLAAIAAQAPAQGGFVASDWYMFTSSGGEIRRYDVSNGSYVVTVPKTSERNNGPSSYNEVTKKLTYVVEGPGYRHLWLTDLEGTFHTQLTFDGQSDGGRFSPDGTKIIYTHSNTSIYDPNLSIQCYDLLTGLTTELVSSSENVSIGSDFLPNGDGFVYSSNVGGVSTLKWVHADNSIQTIGTGGFGGAVVSPDGGRVAYHGRTTGVYRVEEIDLATGLRTFGPEYGNANLSYFDDGSIAFSYGGLRRWEPWSGANDLLIANDSGGPIVARKNAAPVPEPLTAGLCAVALGAAVSRRRR